ncbi:hypothetical protein [Streptomyces sp. KLOTTS4A1]
MKPTERARREGRTPLVEDVAQDNVDVPVIAKRPAAWFPVL